MGSGKAIPSEPTLARSPKQASEVGEEGVASIPLVDLSEPQTAVFNLSRCASFRNPLSAHQDGTALAQNNGASKSAMLSGRARVS
jgi:hypothetical protein